MYCMVSLIEKSSAEMIEKVLGNELRIIICEGEATPQPVSRSDFELSVKTGW